MIPIDTSIDDVKKLTKLMNTTKVSGYDVKEPFFKSRIVEQKFRDIAGGNLSFTMYRSFNNYYVAFPTDIYIDTIEWYKLKSDELPEFYFDLLEKTPH